MLTMAVSFGQGGLDTIMESTVVPVSVAPGVYQVTAMLLSPNVPVPVVCHKTFPLSATPFSVSATLAHMVSDRAVAFATGVALMVTEITLVVLHPNGLTSTTVTVPPPAVPQLTIMLAVESLGLVIIPPVTLHRKYEPAVGFTSYISPVSPSHIRLVPLIVWRSGTGLITTAINVVAPVQPSESVSETLRLPPGGTPHVTVMVSPF